MTTRPPFNRVTPKEAELLACLAEECGEVIQAVTKILRHGRNSVHPVSEINNTDHLQTEIGDLCGILSLMVEVHLLQRIPIERAAEAKMLNVMYYLHHWSDAK